MASDESLYSTADHVGQHHNRDDQRLTYRTIQPSGGFLNALISLDLHRLQFSPSHLNASLNASYPEAAQASSPKSPGLPSSMATPSQTMSCQSKGSPIPDCGATLRGQNWGPGSNMLGGSRSAPASRGSQYQGRLDGLSAASRGQAAVNRVGTAQPSIRDQHLDAVRGTALSRAALDRVHRAELTLERLKTPGAPIDSRPPSRQLADEDTLAHPDGNHSTLSPPTSTKAWSRHLGGMMTNVANRRAAHRATASAWATQLADSPRNEHSLVLAAQKRAQALLLSTAHKRKPHKHGAATELSGPQAASLWSNHRCASSQAHLAPAEAASNSPRVEHSLAQQPQHVNVSQQPCAGVMGPAEERHQVVFEMSAPNMGQPDSAPQGAASLLQPCHSVPASSRLGSYEEGLRVLQVATPGWAVAVAAGNTNEYSSEYAGVYGTVAALRKQLQAERRAVIARNPAAYKEDVAARAEALSRDFTLKAERSLQRMSNDVNSKANSDFYMALEKLRAQRPYWQGPTQLSRGMDIRVAATQGRQAQVWTMDKSVFAIRRRDNQHQDVVDTTPVYDALFDLDWATATMDVELVGLARSVQLLAEDGDSDEEAGHALPEVKQLIKPWQHHLVALFNACCLQQTSQVSVVMMDTWRVSEQQWLELCGQLRLQPYNIQQAVFSDIFKHCASTDRALESVSDCDEDWSTSSSDSGTELERKGLTRPQFLRGVLHLALMAAQGSTDSGAAIQGFVKQVIAPAVPAGLMPDHLNTFRQQHLYCEACDRAIQQHWGLLLGAWRLYKAKDGNKYLQLDNWRNLMTSLGITGLSSTAADHAFVISQMVMMDEASQPDRSHGLTFIDFVEALARVAQAVGMATNSGSPLADHLTAFLDHASSKLQELWGGASTHDCGSKMCRMAAILNPGGSDAS